MTKTTSPAIAPSPVEAHFRALQSRTSEILEQSLVGDFGASLAKSHSATEDICAWVTVLEQRLEAKLLEASLREYQFALYAVASGLYRHAFAALRLFLELALNAVFLSANELHLRQWLTSRRDSQWGGLANEESGLFSLQFADAFCPPLRDEVRHFRNLAVTLYRECSEFVHGNVGANDALPPTLAFSPETYDSWHVRAQTARFVVQFSLALRYLCELSEDEKSALEHVLLEELGHMPQVRALIDGTTAAE